jgi:hypothetical protein
MPETQKGFVRLVTAIVATILSEKGRPMELGGRVADEILDRIARMPDSMRLPLRILTTFFGTECIVLAGHRFDCLPLDGRRGRILAWKRSRLGIKRDLVRFYESLAIFLSSVEPHE